MIEHYHKHKVDVLMVLVLCILIVGIVNLVLVMRVAAKSISISSSATANLKNKKVPLTGPIPSVGSNDAAWRALYYKDRIARLAQGFKHTADEKHNARCVTALTEYYTRRTDAIAKQALRTIQAECPVR